MWTAIEKMEGIEAIKLASELRTQVIFKHSTRCSISSMAKSRLERAGKGDDFDLHYLDLIRHRDISNAIAEQFNVQHESPQILVIKKGQCTYDESHNGIRMDEILEQL